MEEDRIMELEDRSRENTQIEAQKNKRMENRAEHQRYERYSQNI
jgi:hypothetical protein